MSTSTRRTTAAAPTWSASPTSPAHPWLTLTVVACAQLMVALDATVVNVALPTAQRALTFSDADRQWVITAYTLALAGLLLLGGRLGDLLGRRRAFLAGLAGFAASSALAGAAPTFAILVTGRALQGASAALLTPTALALVGSTFRDPQRRARAFAVYGAVASGGGAAGLLLGGAFTQYASWRWALYVNVGIGLLALAAGTRLLPPPQEQLGAARPRLDVAGAALAIAGLVAVVYGCSRAATAGWSSLQVLGLLAAGLLLLAVFWVWQARTPNPLLPLAVLRSRARAGVYVAVGCAVVGSFGLFLLLTYYLQTVRGYSPVRTGLAFLPLSAAVAASATGIASPLLTRVAPRTLIVPGLLAAAAGLGLLTRLDVHTGYLQLVLPAQLLLGAGLGCVFTPAFSVATGTVAPRDAGIAAAVVQTANQIGASVGTAVLNTVAAAATAHQITALREDALPAALVHGYTTATGAAAVLLLASAAAAALTVPGSRPDPTTKEHL